MQVVLIGDKLAYSGDFFYNYGIHDVFFFRYFCQNCAKAHGLVKS